MAIIGKRVFTHLLALLLGFGLSYWYFYIPQDTNKDKTTAAQTNQETLIAQESSRLSQQQRISQLKRQVKLLQKRLAEKTHTSRPSNSTASEQSTQQAETAEDHNLTKMSIEDFNSMMQESFVSRSRSIIIQFDEDRLADLKSDFEELQETNEESMTFQDQLAQYIVDNDPLGSHFINAIDCKIAICRLEVNTSQMEAWEKLYLEMSQQAWFKSVTIEEPTEYPENIVYYLLKQNN